MNKSEEPMAEVYIPTRGRWNLLCKTAPAWWEVGASINYVVRRDEVKKYEAAMAEVLPKLSTKWEKPCKIAFKVLPARVKGMGAIRDWCCQEAVRDGHDVIIMSDDDIYPHHSADLRAVEYHATNDFVIGMGCVVSQHDLLLGADAWRVKEDSPIFCASGYGFRMFALNLGSVEACGGFDPALDVCFEDAELMRQGVAGGSTWWLHPAMRAVPLGKRYASGGIADLTGSSLGREAAEVRCQSLVAERWPGFMTTPPRKPMFQWKRFMDQKLPGWRMVTEWDQWMEWWYSYADTAEFLKHSQELTS
jgi:hypothetical protein